MKPLRICYSAFSSLIIVCALGAFCSLEAQWHLLTISPLGPPRGGYSNSIVYKHGLLWAGFTTIAYSKDSGETWKQFLLPTDGHPVTDIDVFDSNHIVFCSQQGIYLTKNGGASWENNPSNEIDFHAAGFTSVAYFGSSKNLIATSAYFSQIWNSTNGGDNWNELGKGPGTQPAKVIYHPSGVALLVDGYGAGDTGAYLYSSSDVGATWQQRGSLAKEGYDLAYGGCNNEFIYVAESDPVGTANPALEVSTDGGVSFQQMFTTPPEPFCGSIAIGKDALFCQTYTNGVICSTDGGFSWKSIGGPNGGQGETRTLTAIDNNTIIAGDSVGNIYITYNCGGDSIPSRFPVVQTPFLLASTADTIEEGICGASSSAIGFGVDICDTGLITLQRVTLTGSNHFLLSEIGTLPRSVTPSDSIEVTYSNRNNTVDTAFIQLSYMLLGVNRDTTIALIGKGSSSVLNLQNGVVFFAGKCNPVTVTAGFGGATCDSGAVTLTGVKLSGSKNFTMASSGTLPRQVANSDAINLIYTNSTFTEDTAILTFSYTAFGKPHDTTMLLIGVGWASQPLRVGYEGTVNVALDSEFLLPIIVNFPDTLLMRSLNLQNIAYSVAFDTSIIVFPPDSDWTSDFTGLPGGVVTAPTFFGGAYSVQEQVIDPDTLLGVTTIGTFKFKTKSRTSPTTPIALTSLSLQGAATSIHFCVSPENDNVALIAANASGVAESSPAPMHFECYPNPVSQNHNLTIALTLGSASNVALDVYDILGHRLFEKSLGRVVSGTSNFNIPFESAGSGSYFVRIQAGDEVKTLKIRVLE